MNATTERVRELRRTVTELRASVAELSEHETTADAEAYWDRKAELSEAEVDVLSYTLRNIADFSDPRHAAELALGDHDHDGGLA